MVSSRLHAALLTGLLLSVATAPSAFADGRPQKQNQTPDPALADIVKRATQVGISKSSVSFPSIYVGKTAEQTVKVLNQGTEELSIYQYSIGDSANFSSVAECKDTILPGEACEVKVIFNPTTPGMLSTKLHVESSATAHPVSVTLFGKAIEVTKTVTPDSIDDIHFELTDVGSPAPEKSFKFRNKGNNPVTIQRFFVKDDDSFQVSSNCNRSIAPNETCAISISVVPGSILPVERLLSVDSDSTRPFPSVKMHAQGKAAILDLGTKVDFGEQIVQRDKISTVVLKNIGNDIFQFPIERAIHVQGNDFRAQNSSCKPELKAGESCEVAVSMKPSQRGLVSGKLLVGEQAVELQGFGLQGKGQSLPNKVTFEDTPLKVMSTVQTVLFSNQGDATLTIFGFDVIAGQSSFNQSNDCPKELEVGASCQVAIAMTPDTVGALKGTLAIKTNGDAEVLIQLEGGGKAIETKSEEQIKN